MLKQVLCALALLPLGCLAAETDDWISPDRPDFVDAPTVLGKGRVQLEMGWLQSKEERSTPWMLRLGVAESLELRLESEGRILERSSPERERGWADAALGVKWHAMEGAGWEPSLGVVLQADFATGSREFKGSGTRPSVLVPMAWELPDDFKLGVMPGYYRDRDENGRHFSTALFGVTLEKEFSDRAYGFVELAAPRIAKMRHGGSTGTFSIGGGYALTRDVMVDTAMVLGLNRRTPDAAFTVGLSVRM